MAAQGHCRKSTKGRSPGRPQERREQGPVSTGFLKHVRMGEALCALRSSLGRTGRPPTRRSPSTPTGCRPGAPPSVPGRGLPSPWASSKTQPRAEHPDVGHVPPGCCRSPQAAHPPPGTRDPQGRAKSGEQAGPPTHTLSRLPMTVLPEGHRLFMSTDVVSDVRVLEPQQLSCKDPACPRSARTGRWPRAASHWRPSPALGRGTGTVPAGAPLRPFLLPSCTAQRSQHPGRLAHLAPSRDPQVPEKPSSRLTEGAHAP